MYIYLQFHTYTEPIVLPFEKLEICVYIIFNLVLSLRFIKKYAFHIK